MVRMRILVICLLLATSWSFASERISEQAAVAQLKKTPAYALDSALPNRTFGSWVADKFPDWNIQWELHDCGQIKIKNSKGETVAEGPICVLVNIMQPGQKLVRGEPADGFHLLFLVGSEKHGLLPASRLVNARRTDGDEVTRLQGLGEVEP